MTHHWSISKRIFEVQTNCRGAGWPYLPACWVHRGWWFNRTLDQARASKTVPESQPASKCPGRRFATALLPLLFGTNPRSHHKGATGRVPHWLVWSQDSGLDSSNQLFRSQLSKQSARHPIKDCQFWSHPPLQGWWLTADAEVDQRTILNALFQHAKWWFVENHSPGCAIMLARPQPCLNVSLILLS